MGACDDAHVNLVEDRGFVPMSDWMLGNGYNKSKIKVGFGEVAGHDLGRISKRSDIYFQ